MGICVGFLCVCCVVVIFILASSPSYMYTYCMDIYMYELYMYTCTVAMVMCMHPYTQGIFVMWSLSPPPILLPHPFPLLPPTNPSPHALSSSGAVNLYGLDDNNGLYTWNLLQTFQLTKRQFPGGPSGLMRYDVHTFILWREGPPGCAILPENQNVTSSCF